MLAFRAIAFICCICACVAATRADVPRATDPHRAAAAAAPLSAQARLPGAAAKEVELIAALGRAWGERALGDLLAAFRIEGKPPVIPRDDINAHLQNRPLGVELTFSRAGARDVPVRGVPFDTPVLSNIRLYGPGWRTHQAFKGELPFGLRFGDTKDALVARLGLPDWENLIPGRVTLMRWDTEPYTLFAQLDKAGKLDEFSLQLPVVATNRPGFEAR
jgi:hypothetical protein